MSYKNPLYRPDWKEIYEYHHEQWGRAHKESGRLGAGDFTPETRHIWHEVGEDMRRHTKGLCGSFRFRYPTIREYAEWMFREFQINTKDYDGPPLPRVDFDELRTLEDAEKAWNTAHRMVEEVADEKRQSLPIGQPEGVAAFADLSSPKLDRFWRYFHPKELYPGDGVVTGQYGVRTLITVDELDDGWHVCFMHDWTNLGPSVTNTIEHLATALWRHAREQDHATYRLFGLPVWKDRRALAPGRFSFYEHYPPCSGGHGEQFDRVRLRFEKGQYCDPEWDHFKVVPKAIQSARFDLALDASIGGITRKDPE